jgi:hypothetical protein
MFPISDLVNEFYKKPFIERPTGLRNWLLAVVQWKSQCMPI